VTAFVFEIFFDRGAALEHVQKVRVAAGVQLHRPVEVDATLAEEAREHAGDRRPDLGSMLVDDRQALPPKRRLQASRDEDGMQ
jgi:hypothetical protein